jgi:hypothetical protein
MAISEAQLVELTRRHHAWVLTVRERTVAAVARLWDLVQPIGDTEADQFTRQAVTVVIGAQAAVSSSTAGFLRLATGVDGPSTLLTGALLRGGADPLEVYRRGVITARRALSDGKSREEALRIGRDRTLSTTATDVMLPQRAQIDEWVKVDKVWGYRRVLTGSSCALCALASTQRYHRENLMPIHSHCDCGVSPIIGDRDPGRIINRPLHKKLKDAGVIDDITAQRALPKARTALENTQARIDKMRAELKAGIPDQARETRVEQRLDKARQTLKQREERVARLEELRRERPAATKVIVDEHGELGPVLTRPGDTFTSQADLPGS